MPDETVVDFDAAIQSLSALNAAAYRLAGVAACQIDTANGRYVCRLTPTSSDPVETVRARFIQLVTDENLRESLHARTEPLRNLILSLAFAALATQPGDKPDG